MNYFTKDKPYNALSNYYKTKYGKKVCKVSLNAGFSCPNKDGKKGVGGCTYCSSLGSGDFAGSLNDSLNDQYFKIKKIMNNKWNDTLYIPYLQANSNTYGNIEKLTNIYDQILAIDDKDIIGLDIATRSDCIDEDICKLVYEYNKKLNITVELGLQTSNEATSILINRCETNDEFTKAVNLLRKYNIEIVVHIINGLPNETFEDMLNTIKFINKHDIQGVKFHSLLIIENTKMAQDYKLKPFKILTLDEYVDITCKQICLLRDDIIIHRLAADAKITDLIEPIWTTKKLVVMNEIDKYMRNNNLYQGMYIKKEAN